MLIAGDAPRFTVSVPTNPTRTYKDKLHINFDRLICLRVGIDLLLPEPDPELVEVELLPGEGVPGSGDRARPTESAEATN